MNLGTPCQYEHLLVRKSSILKSSSKLSNFWRSFTKQKYFFHLPTEIVLKISILWIKCSDGLKDKNDKPLKVNQDTILSVRWIPLIVKCIYFLSSGWIPLCLKWNITSLCIFMVNFTIFSLMKNLGEFHFVER